MEIIPNNKGGHKIAFDGYLYTKKRTAKESIQWEYSNRGSLNCLGKLRTNIEMTTCSVTTTHSHPADKAMIEASKIKATLKSKATMSRTKAGQLLADTLVDSPTEVRVALGNKESVKRTIRNNQNKSLPSDPKTIGEFVIEGEWCLTEGNEKKQFLIHDSGADSSNRVVVFATKDCLQHLSNSSTWFMDGTFSSSPNIFTQVYVICAPVGETAITCVYALIRNKQQSSYEEVLNAVLSKSEDYGFFQDPQVIITDFEQAALNAVHVTFGESVRRQGCFYHLTQSTLRKIQSLGLVTLYKEKDTFKHWCGILDGIAFLPLEDVPSGMQWVKENCPSELGELVSYFDSTYVSGGYRKVINKDNNGDAIPIVRMCRLPPLYPPSIWNVNYATLNDGARTNNLCEGWNYGFQQLLGHNHPSIWKVILAFQQDNANAHDTIHQHLVGERQEKRIRKNAKVMNDRLKRLYVAYQEGKKTIPEFLKGVGYNIRF